MDDAALARVLLLVADRLEEVYHPSVGVIRAAARRLTELSRLDLAVVDGGCAKCGSEIDQPATGRRRIYCGACARVRRKVANVVKRHPVNMNQEDRREIARHEAGHAVMSWLVGHDLELVRSSVHFGTTYTKLRGDDILGALIVVLAGSEYVGRGGTADDLEIAERLAAKLRPGAMGVARELTAGLVRSAPFRYLAEGIAEALLANGGELPGRLIEEYCEREFPKALEAVHMDEELKSTPDELATDEEIEARRTRLRALGVEGYTDDWDVALVEYEMDRRMKDWKADYWRLPTPKTEPSPRSKPEPEELPEEVEVTLRNMSPLEHATPNRELRTKKTTIRGEKLEAGLKRGYTLVEHRDENGKVSREVYRSRSATRALDGRGRLIGDTEVR